MQAPSSLEVATDTPVASLEAYRRESPDIAADDIYLVGAYWYPWYSADGRHWSEGYRDTPLLGTYDSADSAVINQQIDWATGHGVDFFVASWWGRDTFEDTVIHDAFLETELSDDIRFAILYESQGLLKAQGASLIWIARTIVGNWSLTCRSWRSGTLHILVICVLLIGPCSFFT